MSSLSDRSFVSGEQFTRHVRHATAPAKGIRGITGRELEALTLIGQGMSNPEISQAMGISAATVKSYVTRLLAKLDARDRAQLVISAYENGLVAPGGQSIWPDVPT